MRPRQHAPRNSFGSARAFCGVSTPRPVARPRVPPTRGLAIGDEEALVRQAMQSPTNTGSRFLLQVDLEFGEAPQLSSW